MSGSHNAFEFIFSVSHGIALVKGHRVKIACDIYDRRVLTVYSADNAVRHPLHAYSVSTSLPADPFLNRRELVICFAHENSAAQAEEPGCISCVIRMNVCQKYIGHSGIEAETVHALKKLIKAIGTVKACVDQKASAAIDIGAAFHHITVEPLERVIGKDYRKSP